MFEAEYARRRTTAEAEAGRICSGDTVYLAGGPLLPVDFAAALHRRAAELHGVRVLNSLPLESLALLTDPACGDAFQIESIFYNTYQQEAQRLGRCAFLPNHLRNAARDWTHGAPEYDCLVLTVSPMDKHGCFSLAGSACIELEVLPRARRVVVEVASCAPRIFGDVTLHVSQVDAIVESDRYPAALSPQPPDEVDRQLGRVVAELVEDGATIQLGFGGTINALAAELKDKRGLGIHTEAMSDAAMELLRCGAADNSRKSLHRGKTVTCFTMGSHALYDFVDDNPTILQGPELHQRSVCFGGQPGHDLHQCCAPGGSHRPVRLGECGAPADLGQRRTGGHRRRRTDGAGGQVGYYPALHLLCKGPGHGGAASPVPYTAGTAGGGRGDPYPEQYPLCGHRVWRGLFAGADGSAAGQGPYLHRPPGLSGLAGGGVSPHLPPVTARPYVETESGPGTDGFRGR